MKRSLLFIFFGILFPLVSQAHNDDGYYHDDADLPAQKDWMARLHDDLSIKDISIPGTHDSGSLHGGDIVQTQTLSIFQQLNAGIRFLDIRLRHINDVFTIHHGPVYQRQMFEDVLNATEAFLQQNPSETVLMRVKKEHTEEGNSRKFEDTFNDYYNRYQNIIWRPSSWSDMPKLSDTRGKIVFLQNFSGGGYRSFGLSYNNFDIQDNYTISTNWDLHRKWTKVKEHINKAASSTPARGSGFINYLSASGGSFPYFVASGHSSPGTSAARLLTGKTTPGWWHSYPDFPRVDCFIGICPIAFEGTNTLTKNYIYQQRPRYVGIIAADFPGAGLIGAVINTNF